MIIKFKKLVSHAEIPKYATNGSVGLDLVATDACYHSSFDYIEFGTGIAVQIPKGYVGFVVPRSSISNTPHFLRNSVGVIDNDYTGEIIVRMGTKDNKQAIEYQVGDRVAQLVITSCPKVELEEVNELEKTERGDQGFGSTGK